MLVIDDNADMRNLIESVLGEEYQIYQAADGREGLAKAVRFVPDIIISDIMMPVMDGLEFCRRVKSEVTTSHIPVVMLTACAQDEQRVEGYDCGADGYISKPFSGEVLRARCRNLLDNRKLIRNLWQGGEGVAPSHTIAEQQAERPDDTPVKSQKPDKTEIVGNTDPDNEFYNRFLAVFRQEMSDPNLNVEQLAAAMGLGHSQFYRKIKALTNYSPVELMRQLRLRRGQHLLKTSTKTVSEIAYEVGFSSPAYFTKCYRTVFGETPSELRDRLAL
ncbi:MAG: response regulator [Muribaculaceae bacterium]|nr:response regulator [Muribaculaceae bacterium]